MVWERVMEQTRRKQFELGATLPTAWEYAAHNLKRAADRLLQICLRAQDRIVGRVAQEMRESSERTATPLRVLEGEELEDSWDAGLGSVYLFLLGCSIENLLKGILMSKHPEYLQQGKLRGVKDHDLVKLCGRCSINLSAGEKQWLEKLSAYIRWAGRYPVPLSEQEMFPQRLADGSWAHNKGFTPARDAVAELGEIWERLWREFKATTGRRTADNPSISSKS